VRFALLAVVSACGRIGFGTSGPSDAPGIDAPVDADLGRFATPVVIGELVVAAEQDDDPTLTDDLLEIYFDTSRPPSVLGDIWVARRMSATDPFDAPSPVAELHSDSDDTSPEITGDGLTMYFSSDRITLGDRELYMTSRPDRVSSWSPPIQITALSSPAEESGAIETADGLGLVFASNRSGSLDLYRASRSAIGQPWQSPTPIAGLSDPAVEESLHWINHDATVVYFASDRPPSVDLDIWVASRPTPADAFAPPVHVVELASSSIDADPWLSSDLRTIVFMSYRTGSGDLYISTR
jgi:Tol biopolymer transport system component